MDDKDLQELKSLLDKRATGGDTRAVDGQIVSRFEKECTVMVSDLSSFAKTTNSMGIVHTMGLIAKAHKIAEPILRTLGGEVLRADPESLVVLFKKPMDAVMAARAVNRAFDEYNSGVGDSDKISICLGVGHGKVIRAADRVYGDQVNQAHRIGEDVAGKCAVRLTPEAYEGVKNLTSVQFRSGEAVQTGGLTIRPYELIFA